MPRFLPDVVICKPLRMNNKPGSAVRQNPFRKANGAWPELGQKRTRFTWVDPLVRSLKKAAQDARA